MLTGRRAATRRRWLGVSVAVVIAVGLVTPSARAAATNAPRPTVVSLTFDDGWETQLAAAPILSANGLAATFYVNTDTIGTPQRLTLAQLTSLQADGFEIGGHTLDHVALAGAPAAEQAREVCDDRVALIRAGFEPESFAYPYGSFDAAAEKQVAACGYNSARGVGILDPATGCNGCAYAESIPPTNPYAIVSEGSVTATTSVAEIEQHIDDAMNHGGGWTPLVFHDVCAACSSIAITPDHFAELMSWIKSQESNGLAVKTVGAVIGGGVRPPVNGPALASGPNAVLQNPALEQPTTSPSPTTSDADGEPSATSADYCWSRTGYGSNTATWARVPGHSGLGEQATMTAWTSGDRKLLTTQDTGTCAPKISAGASYRLSAWYRSTTPTRVLVYYKVDGSDWRFWTQSSTSPPSSTWRQLVWTTPTAPRGAVLVSFGLQIAEVGTLATDDYSITQQPAASVVSSRTAHSGIWIGWWLIGFAVLSLCALVVRSAGRLRRHRPGYPSRSAGR